MALKSILDIDVNDEAFRRYQEQFKKYTDLLAQTPDAWKSVTKEIDASRKSFSDLVAAAAARQGYARLTAEAEAVAARSVEQQARSWGDMARSTRTVAGNIIDATRALLRWAGITAGVSGLLGAGGLWGIDRLAQSAAGQRRSSTGLGISAGEQSAFGLNYGRLVDTGGVLEGVNAALTSPSLRGGLYRAGLSERDIAGHDAAQVSVTLINKLKQLADRTPTQLLGNIVGAYGLGAFGINEQDLQRLKGRSSAEVAGYASQFNRDSAALNLSPGPLTAWENFKVQLERAGHTIETDFIRSLTDLTGPLGDLSKAFSGLVHTLLGSDPAKNLIEGIASGLNDFARTVGSDSFRKDVVTFAEDIGKLAHGIHTAIGWLFDKNNGGGPDPGSQKSFEQDPELQAQAQNSWEKFLDWLKSHLSGTAGIAPLGYGGGSYGDLLHYAIYSQPIGGGDAPLDLIRQYESNNQNVPNYRYDSTHTAQGYYQITNSTWREIAPRVGAGQYPNAMSAPFDVQTAVARELFRERGIQPWSTNGPLMEHYRNGDGSRPSGIMQARGQQVTINIFNNTGGSAIVQASAMA